MFTLRYPRENDPHYLLTHTSEGAWRFKERDAALGAYNAGLRYQSLLHFVDHRDEYSYAGKQLAEVPEVALEQAWREFEEACVVVRQRGKKSRNDRAGGETVP